MILRGFVLELTKKHDLSQTEIARRSGLSQPLIHKILTGMGTPQVRSYQKLAAAFPEAWNDYLLRHPALQEELVKAFGWVNRAREVDVGARQDKLELLEAILGLAGPPVPPEARARYQKRLREVMHRASRELQKYRNKLRAKSRTRQGRLHPRG